MDDMDSKYVIPLAIEGVTSSFPTRKATMEEFESLPHLCLTSEDPPYDPHDTTFAQQESALMKSVLVTGDRIGAAPPSRYLCSVAKMKLYAENIGTSIDGASLSIQQLSDTLDDRLFTRSLTANIAALNSKLSTKFDPELLAKKWGIDKQTAHRTVNVKMQRGVRTMLHPTLSRRFRTNDRQLRYRRLPVDCFTDTLISNTPSRQNNKYAQIFSTPEGWCRADPMAKKSDAHP
jgi:hypothetical protein